MSGPQLKALNLGRTELPNNVLAAPMCGVSLSPFRYLSRRLGAGLVCTEMTAAEAVLRAPEKSKKRLAFRPEERPVSIQLCGADPDIMAQAVEQVRALEPDAIDLNLGCPVPKVVHRLAGAGLLKDPVRAVALARAAVGAAGDIPVTAKFRLGWDEKTLTYDQVGPGFEEAGIKLLAVHARTRSMRFSGEPLWDHVARLKRLVGIPVIANGDINSPTDALKVMEATGADGVMLGRGAVKNPWLFRQIQAALGGGRAEGPKPVERVDVLRELRDGLLSIMEERTAVPLSRGFAAALLSGMEGSRWARGAYFQAQDASSQDRVLKEIRSRWEGLVHVAA